jgi:hypothetical protein
MRLHRFTDERVVIGNKAAEIGGGSHERSMMEAAKRASLHGPMYTNALKQGMDMAGTRT